MARHFILFSVVLLSLLSTSVSDNLFWSVNCGASDSYVDENEISWAPDENLVSNGIAAEVQQDKKISTVLSTLRFFTSRNKNCYSIPIEKGKKVLVRASFNYGNYDGKSSPPTFALHFNGNFWANVGTFASEVTVYEATYVTKGDPVSVCVAKTKTDQYPFMSSLEVRTIDPEVYSDVDESLALLGIARIAYGANEPLRYPDDPYDRIWMKSVGETERVQNEATSINSAGINNPPEGILKNGITVESPLILDLGILVNPNIPVYIAMYFSEVMMLDDDKTRSFKVHGTWDSKDSDLSPPILPPYEAVFVWHRNNYIVNSITNISLQATDGSAYPPLINALEMFQISGPLTDGTNSNDVEALGLLQTKFDVLGEWSGDPCLPAPFSWDWLNCSDDTPPRITSLLLDGFDLSGSLPDISSLDALEIIDLHNNSLSGEIPSFLGTMPNLKELNLGDNQFTGPIPTSLLKKDKVILTVTGNPSLCTSGNSSCYSSAIASCIKLPIVILGTTIPAFFLIWGLYPFP